MSDATPPTDPQPTPPGVPPVTPPADPEPLGDAGKKALEAEREARKAADKRAKDAETELTRLKAEAQQQADAEAAAQGKYRELAEKREADLTQTRESLKAIETERDALRQHVTADIDAAIKDPAYKPFLRFDPGAEAPIAERLKWLTEAKAAIAEILQPKVPGGNPPNPKPGSGQLDIAQEAARARASGRYSI